MKKKTEKKDQKMKKKGTKKDVKEKDNKRL